MRDGKKIIRAAGLLALLAVTASLSTASALAYEPEDPIPANPYKENQVGPTGHPGVTPRGDALPQAVVDRFKDCPTLDEVHEQAPGLFYVFCAEIVAYDGELKLGNVTAEVAPIKMLVGIATAGPDDPIVVIPAGGGDGGPGVEPVKISGGILGVPALDPLIDNEPLGLLKLTATPEIGELVAESGNRSPTYLNRITLPLSIKLNNTLFGENCRIGTTAEPITIDLVVETPPVLSPEEVWNNYLLSQGDDYDTFGVPTRTEGLGAELADQTFEVPGAKKCDLLGQPAHDAIEDLNDQLESVLGADLPVDELLGSEAGLFDLPVNSIAGLPSPAGANYMKIGLNSTAVTDGLVEGVIHNQKQPGFLSEPGYPLDFGEVKVGQSATKTLTLTNPTSDPVDYFAAAASGVSPPFQVVDDGCTGSVAPGEACALQIRFSPTSEGKKVGSAFDFLLELYGTGTTE